MRRRWLPVFALPALALACGESSGPPERAAAASAMDANALDDPGFEEGGEAWSFLGGQRLPFFAVSEAHARSGGHSGQLAFDSRDAPESTPSRGAMAAQELATGELPERLTGAFRVERFERPADDMGLTVQVLVFVMGDPRVMEILRPDDPNTEPPARPYSSYGVNYRLAGQPAASESVPDEGPPGWTNLEFVQVGPHEPRIGEWVEFDLPLREDFSRIWDVSPSGFEKLRILLQVVWTDRTPGAGVQAEVYFDDLVLGPVRAGPAGPARVR